MSLDQSKEHFTENTLFKVYDVLRITGELTEEKSREVINELQNQGILFRERGERPKSVLRARTRGRSHYPVDGEDDDD